MVPVTTDYKFGAPDGTSVTLTDLFAGRSQLIVYHFMFGPDDEEGCRGCSFMAGNFPDLRYLAGGFFFSFFFLCLLFASSPVYSNIENKPTNPYPKLGLNKQKKTPP